MIKIRLKALQNEWQEQRGKTTERFDERRTVDERDFARIVHSAAFRRLQGKTQVLGLGDSDFYRTRLTHSMEVAQVGAAIRNHLYNSREAREQLKNYNFADIRRFLPDPHLISAIGLAHDLGHPPFGHGGEVALNYCMRKHGGFEGNGQTLRILSRLEKYDREYGLNPTRRLLLGVLKYPVSYSKALEMIGKKYEDAQSLPWLIKKDEHKPPKCYLDTEEDIVDWVLKPLCQSDKDIFTQPPVREDKILYSRSLDSSIMDLADDICYSIHDLEDAISLGLITEQSFFDCLCSDDAKNIISSAGNALMERHGRDSEPLEEMLKKLFDKNACTQKGVVGWIIHMLICNCSIKVNDCFHSPILSLNVVMNNELKFFMDMICDVVVKLVIKSPITQQLEFKGQRIIIELFDVLSTDPFRFLPQSTKDKYKAVGDDEKPRVICDYIAGMTDEYAAKLYERLFCPHRGSVFDRL